MSLTRKDPSLRVAANDSHLVSFGSGRLSTAVTIHYIPIGDTTIGSSTDCSITLNGTGVRSTHCTIYRSENNEVTIVPERDARILIDGTTITQETNLTQGAMITIGNSNYLRFNNPAEAQMMRSVLGSNERISMPQIDFTQMSTPTVVASAVVQKRNSTKSNGSASSGGHDINRQSMDIEAFIEANFKSDNLSLCSKDHMKKTTSTKGYSNTSAMTEPIDINGLQCPKVFTADLVTVNMPAKDVLGQKYASFAKNLAENHRSDKIVNNALRNNQVNTMRTNNVAGGSGAGTSSSANNFVNIPSTSNFIQNTNSSIGSSSTEYLAKVNNTTALRMSNATSTNSPHHNVSAYDRYPKPGTYGGLQIYPMNCVNTEINNGSSSLTSSSPLHQRSTYEISPGRSQLLEQKRNLSNLSNSENERLEDMLKICTEYADRQNQSTCNSITSSPIVQNRIKTNGSLPRDRSPFYHDLSGGQQSFSGSSSNLTTMTKTQNGPPISTSTGYENVRLVGQNRVEINGQLLNSTSSPKPSYDSVVVGKYVPQSPRTKIRTTCMSPKKDHSFSSIFNQTTVASTAPAAAAVPPPPNPKPVISKQNEYEQLIKTFEEKLKLEMQAIEESSRYQPTASSSIQASLSSSSSSTPVKRLNKNINNLTLNLHAYISPRNSPKLGRKPAPAPRNISKSGSGSLTNLQRIATTTTTTTTVAVTTTCDVGVKIIENGDASVEQLKSVRKEILTHIQGLKHQISELQKQEDEVLRELDLEKALVSAELHSVGGSVGELEHQLQALQNKIHRLEAQRNATRVMEENQQAKLKQSIEMKQDQMKKLKAMLKQKPNNDCLKEELHNVCESLENDRKTFEDLEFQYLEEESEWHAYREELHADENTLKQKIEEKHNEMQHLAKQELTNQSSGNCDARTLKQKVLTLLAELKQCQERLKMIETNICDITGQLHINSSDDDDELSMSENLLSSSSTVSPPSCQQQQSNLISGVMSQSLFGSAELLCPKRSTTDIMSKSVNENMFYNNKIELPPASTAQVHTATSTPKRAQLHVVNIDDDALKVKIIVDNDDDDDDGEALLRSKKSKDNADGDENDSANSDRVKFNLSLGSDDFEVNPLERRVPSQDDIDRISKVTTDAPISTKGATTKIFDSIKEIERNRQLLLAQQGHHVIEHERQKMNDLKKKCHDEARAQYISMLSCTLNTCNKAISATTPNAQQQQKQYQQRLEEGQELQKLNDNEKTNDRLRAHKDETQRKSSVGYAVADGAQQNVERNGQQRHSQPEFESQHHQHQQRPHSRASPRPLSEANSELSYDNLLVDHQHNAATVAGACKSNIELSTSAATSSGIGSSCTTNSSSGKRYSDGVEQNAGSLSGDDAATKRSSVNSNETCSGGSGTGSVSGSGGSSNNHHHHHHHQQQQQHNERKRMLPKHQRPLTRYLPIFSPDLNLRHHIETAGHQIALCPHVFVDAFSCRGYLHKLGATFHGWARRWFVLDRQRNAFIYYADKSERKPRGGAYFSTIDEVYLDHLNASKSGRPHCTFIVKTKKRSYHLQAASDAAARIWIDAIITGAQGNLDY